MKFFTIGSGSSGNCSFLGTDKGGILIDAGISGKRTIQALEDNDLSFDGLDGILITHEHRDHIGCLGVLLRKSPVPVFATQKTIDAIISSDQIGKVDTDLFCPIKVDSDFKIKDINIHTIPISHDAADPVAFRFSDGSHSMAVVTDLGCYNDFIIDYLQRLDSILIEANHDVRMLECGMYPYYLKRRIAGEEGHLSNEACGKLLCEILNDDLKNIILGHLSAENNYERLAMESVELEINLSDNKYRAKDFNMVIAPRKTAMEMIQI